LTLNGLNYKSNSKAIAMKKRTSIITTIFLLSIFTVFAYGGGLYLRTTPKEYNYILFEGTSGDDDMVFIPAGEFIMGSDEEELKPIIQKFGHRADFIGYDFDSEKPRRKVFVKSFYIDRYEVTNAQYKKFIDATGHIPPYHWENGTYPPGRDNYPVINVSWYDAKAYAKWAGKRLPTEEEWEKAARGTDGRIYPWGSEFDPNKVRTAEAMLRSILSPAELLKSAAPVNEYEEDRSPYGVHDMAGNVMEWTDSWYEKGHTRVVKGASWVHLGPRARSASREGVEPDKVSHIIGFRCAADVGSRLKLATNKIETHLQ